MRSHCCVLLSHRGERTDSLLSCNYRQSGGSFFFARYVTSIFFSCAVSRVNHVENGKVLFLSRCYASSSVVARRGRKVVIRGEQRSCSLVVYLTYGSTSAED